jgi:hypothetical protein
VKTRILRHFITAGFGSVASHEVKSSPASMSFNKERTFVHSSVQPTTSLLRTCINATAILRLNSVFIYESNSCNPRGALSNMIGYTLHYRVSIPGRDRHFHLQYKIRTSSGAHQLPLHWIPMDSSLGIRNLSASNGTSVSGQHLLLLSTGVCGRARNMLYIMFCLFCLVIFICSLCSSAVTLAM